MLFGFGLSFDYQFIIYLTMSLLPLPVIGTSS